MSTREEYSEAMRELINERGRRQTILALLAAGWLVVIVDSG